MKIIFCGDRNWTDKEAIKGVMSAIKDNVGEFEIIEGEAKGADTLSKTVAIFDLGIIVNSFPADWDKHGKAAGPIRNTQMLIQGNASAVVAFHNNISQSKGTRDMLYQAKIKKIPTWLSSEGYEKLTEFILKLKRIKYGT